MEKLSAKEAALLDAARRQVQTRKDAAPAPGAAVARPLPAAAEKPQPSAAERIAQLMAAERAETERRKKKLRRYGIILPAAILVMATLWVVRALLRRG
jgi:hypothetical protein